MKFISVEEFLEQDEKIQKIFIDWWKPSVGDLYCNLYNEQRDNILVINKVQLDFFKTFSNDIKKYGFPLLTEGQLRKFIEGKTNCKLNIGNISKIINIYKKELDIPYETDILQAYWQIALEIAEECMGNE